MQKELWEKIKNILKNNKLSILLFLLLLNFHIQFLKLVEPLIYHLELNQKIKI